jgi:A/G-specific adenine glycosylase
VHIQNFKMLSNQNFNQDFRTKLKEWYRLNHRQLQWRYTDDPYKIWLSEIILQQTRVAQGTPYYLKFLESFPTIYDLAAADEKDVLRLWQGLGYYSRARNLHFTAKKVVSDYDGRFPNTAHELIKLKGLGKYTAAAIASFSFQQAVPAIDGNVYRVLSRLFGIYDNILSHAGKKVFEQLGQELICEEEPGIFNQAMIEFGALQCVPVSPNCEICPFNNICYAYQQGKQSVLPVKTKKAPVKHRYINYVVVQQGEQLAMRERSGKDIWKGLYDFYTIELLGKINTVEDLPPDAFIKALIQKGIVNPLPYVYTHLLTHQKLHLYFWWFVVPSNLDILLPEGMHFFDREQVEQLPKPIVIDQLLKQVDYLNE